MGFAHVSSTSSSSGRAESTGGLGRSSSSVTVMVVESGVPMV